MLINNIAKWIIPKNQLMLESENLKTAIIYDERDKMFVGFIHKKGDGQFYLFDMIRSKGFPELIEAVEKYHIKAETGVEQ